MLTHHRQAGFNLVELMISLVLGLLVSLAIIAFIGSAIRSNAQTVGATRLTQELRALTELIARDIRRARSVQDPIANLGTACSGDASATNACAGLALLRSVDLSTAGCIRYGYQGAAAGNFRVVRRAVTGTRGEIVMTRGGATVTCDSAGTRISSNLVDITDFVVTGVGTNQVDIQLEGRLAGNPDSVAQRYRTSVFVRSGGI
jgi:Tfp pilus assembly protein PilW